jgi:outer membrane protein assembly factor BamA
MNQLNGDKQSCYNFGFDYRTYTKLYKNCIWALRVAYAHSDGNSMVEYQLGGVDNWVRPQVANDGASSTNNYGFIAQQTSLRGYKQAARKGNNFAVLSTEVRLPVLTTFIKRPIQSAILKNLQVVAFADMGSAWSGLLPSAENLSNTYQFPKPWEQPGNVFMTVTVPNAAGLALGYGGGLRTVLFGYFVRLDAAWNIDGSKKPMVYFGIGTDF